MIFEWQPGTYNKIKFYQWHKQLNNPNQSQEWRPSDQIAVQYNTAALKKLAFPFSSFFNFFEHGMIKHREPPTE